MMIIFVLWFVVVYWNVDVVPNKYNNYKKLIIIVI